MSGADSPVSNGVDTADRTERPSNLQRRPDGPHHPAGEAADAGTRKPATPGEAADAGTGQPATPGEAADAGTGRPATDAADAGTGQPATPDEPVDGRDAHLAAPVTPNSEEPAAAGSAARPARPLAPPAPVLAEMSRDETPWLRLDSRVIWVDLVMFLLSLLPTVITVFVFNLDFRAGPFGIWPALVATTLGVLGSLGDAQRWLKTRYRITDKRVEQRKGWLTKRYRYIPRERIRSVDNTAKLRHRVAGLRVVHIGSGESQVSLKLDALNTKDARRLHRELMHVTGPDEAAEAGTATAAGRDETVIARLRWFWMWYNLINIWAFLVATILLWGLFWLLQIINIDLRDIIGRIIDWDQLGTTWSIVVAVGGTFAIGVIGLAVGFIKDNWNFELVRTTTGKGTALLTRQGLLDTREIYRDDRRLRGIQISQPLFWRWMGLTETEVISTGLTGRAASGEPASSILPRAPISDVLRVAAQVLPDDVRPLEAPLRPHARAALYRRIVFAVATPAVVTVMLVWFGATGALPAWLWPFGVALLPVAFVLAVIAHRALGHTLVGEYIVVRAGVNRMNKAALQRRAVLSWTARQSLLQRLLGVMSIGVATAAGAKFYRALDLRTGQAVAFMCEVAPELLADFVVRTDGSPANPGQPPPTEPDHAAGPKQATEPDHAAGPKQATEPDHAAGPKQATGPKEATGPEQATGPHQVAGPAAADDDSRERV